MPRTSLHLHPLRCLVYDGGLLVQFKLDADQRDHDVWKYLHTLLEDGRCSLKDSGGLTLAGRRRFSCCNAITGFKVQSILSLRSVHHTGLIGHTTPHHLHVDVVIVRSYLHASDPWVHNAQATSPQTHHGVGLVKGVEP